MSVTSPLPHPAVPPGSEHQPCPTTLCNQDVHNWIHSQSLPSLPPCWLVLLPHTSVTHTTDVNILLWCHQPVLWHNDWLCISCSHCHGFVDKPSTPSLTRPLERLRRGRNLRSGKQRSYICFVQVSLLHIWTYIWLNAYKRNESYATENAPIWTIMHTEMLSKCSALLFKYVCIKYVTMNMWSVHSCPEMADMYLSTRKWAPLLQVRRTVFTKCSLHDWICVNFKLKIWHYAIEN